VLVVPPDPAPPLPELPELVDPVLLILTTCQTPPKLLMPSPLA
jgi:hypothetical protein